MGNMSQYNRNNKSKGESSNISQTNKRKQNVRGPRKPARARGVQAAQFIAEASQSKPHAASSQRVVSRYAPLARQILSPATCPAEILPTPNSCSRQVCPRRYVRVVDYTPPASGHFSVYMSPDLYLPGLITNGDTKVVPAVAGPLALDSRFVAMHGDTDNVNMEAKIYPLGDESESVLVKTEGITDSVGTTLQGFDYHTASGTQITITNNTANTLKIQLWRIPVATGEWTMAQDLLINRHSSYTNLSATTVTAYALKAAAHSLLPVGGFTMSLSCDTAQHTSFAGLSFSPAYSKKIGELDVTEGRVISMSFKITNTSNALSKGGNISIGRVPSSFSPFGSISQNMSRLPSNRRYQDAAETGGYAFWLPEQGDEWEFDNIDKKKAAYSNANYLLAHVSGLPDAAAFRITFAWVVEFYTESENFPKVNCPISSPAWLEVQKLLMIMDASCCNPESANIFKRFLQSGVTGVKALRDHYYDNEATYKQVLALAKHLAGALM